MIHNIHILVNPPVPNEQELQVQVAYEILLVEAHRKGEHPWGSMRRDCPLCQLDRER